MGAVLGTWREIGKISVVTLLAVCAVTFLQHPHYASQSAVAHEMIAAISNPQIQKQMTVTVALSQLLPVGVKGLLCAILLMGIFGGDSTHLHSWGGIFVQDVLLARRKKPFTPAQHVRMLRLGICGVALFAFLFGCFFRQTEYISMWWSVTTSIFVGGAGSAIIGGLYWKKGTTAGAWAALLTGSTLSVSGILLRAFTSGRFPLNGVQVAFCSMLVAISVYVLVSLLTSKADFNLDRMLHRGIYADNPPVAGGMPINPDQPRRKLSWGRIIGFDGDFTKGDKIVSASLFAWSMLWVGVMIVGSVWNFVSPWPTAWWSAFWHVAGIGIPIVVTVVTSVWFTWGGVRDIRTLFERLRSERSINPLDVGVVVDHQNLDGAAVAEEVFKEPEVAVEMASASTAAQSPGNEDSFFEPRGDSKFSKD